MRMEMSLKRAIERAIERKSPSECPGQGRREIRHVFLQGKPALNEGWEEEKKW